MYRRILLAYDGTLEGAVALREGALLARQSRAKVFILSVAPQGGGVALADGVYAAAVSHQMDSYKDLLAKGVARLRQLGLEPIARLTVGEPVKAICAFAREVDADLVVVGHQKKGLLDRWWSGSTGAYLSDYIRCSLLIARNQVSDEEFAAEIEAATEKA
ncbi:MAG TPA: universal stress protein [Caulobacteraceae bacterium]